MQKGLRLLRFVSLHATCLSQAKNVKQSGVALAKFFLEKLEAAEGKPDLCNNTTNKFFQCILKGAKAVKICASTAAVDFRTRIAAC